MNHTQILKRAWNILWSYKMLWAFGILLAITAGGGGNPSNYTSSANDFQGRRFDMLPSDVQRELRGLERLFTHEMVSFWIGLSIALLCLVLLLIVVFTIVKYVSQTALIRMVDDHETTGEKVGFRQGWRLGWSRYAGRLFLIDLAIFLPLALIFIVLFGCAMLPVIFGAASGRGGPVIGSVLTTIGLVFVVIFFVFIVALAVSLVINLIYRACVMEGMGVIDSIRLGVRRLRERFKDVFVMWLLLIGVHIGYAILIIPVVFLLLGIGLVTGGAVGLATYFGLQAVTSQVAAIVTAVILGMVLLITIMGIPLTFLEGLRLTYFSTTWTLTYRELTTVKLVESGPEAEVLPPPTENMPAGTAPA
jgi:hypothetical protein